jgi:hypothetical protein
MITSVLLPLLFFAGAVLLVTAALSPIETLSWWAGWTEEEIHHCATAPKRLSPHADRDKLYVVYLSGVSSISGRFLIPREKVFIKSLRRKLPNAVIIDDVFPYSPTGLTLLAAPRFFERLWRWVQKLKLEGRGALPSLFIKIRNIFQVMISADHRYGPIFNQGAARVIEAALSRAGYCSNSNSTIVIIGYSGGAQIAIGAAPFLKAELNAPIDVISIGGVMASDPGLRFVRRLHHIIGDRDSVRKAGAVMFPERWGVMAHSEWNTAMREGRILIHKLDRMIHAGAHGYFGLPKVGGVSNNERTLAEVVRILTSTPISAHPGESRDPDCQEKDLYTGSRLSPG